MATGGVKRPYRQGGRNQRQRLREELADDIPANVVSSFNLQSKLAIELVEEWAWGACSATHVQHMCSKALEDQRSLLERLSPPGSSDHLALDLLKLAGLGARGRYPANCNKELLNFLGSPRMPKPFVTNVEIILQRRNRRMKRALSLTREMPMKFLLPHEVFAYLYAEFPKTFNKLFLGRPVVQGNELPTWWREVSRRRDPRIQHHPMLAVDNWESVFVPFAVHGDAVPCIRTGRAGTKSLDAYSWHGLLGSGSTKYVKHYIVSVFKQSATKKTLPAIWEVLCWSFMALFLGVWPSTDHKGVAYSPTSAQGRLAGTPLAGGLRAVLWLIKGDLLFFSDDLGLRNVTSLHPCDWCPCHRIDEEDENLQVFNFAINAEWKRMLLSVLDWRRLPGPRHLLFRTFTFLSQMNCEGDELHVMYGGVYQALLGSVLWVLIYVLLPGTAVANMATVWSDIQDLYNEFSSPCRYSSLTLSCFHDPARPRHDYPRLKGRGMEVKHLLLPVAAVFKKYNRAGHADYSLAQNVLDTLADIQCAFDSTPGNFLDPEDANRVLEMCDRFLHDYATLNLRASAKGDLLWHVLPKFHVFWHLCYRSRYVHPRLGNTCLDEDYVGKLKLIVAKSTAGVPLHGIPNKIVDKFSWGKTILYGIKSNDI